MQTPAGPPPPPYPSLPQPGLASRRYNPWAIVSVSFGASTVIGTWCFGGLVAVITGHIARQQIKRTGEAGSNLALIGLIAGYAAIALTLMFILAYILFFVFFFAFAATHAGSTPSPSPQSS
jgi:hypothetical protein